MANKLVLELLADSNNLLKAMEQSQKSLGNFIKASDTAGNSLGGGVNRALDSFMNLSKGGALAAGVLAGTIVAAGVAATAFAISAGHQAEELSQLSSVMGIGTDTLQEYDVLLNRVGLGGQDLSLVMKTLSQKMEEAKTGTGAAADRFRQLGIDITKVTSTDDLIRKIADSVSKFSNGTEKAAAMADLLGKGGLKFIPAFEGGAAAINEAAAASKRLGATLSAFQIETLGKMDDSVDDLGLSWRRFSQQLGAFFAPAVDLAVQGLTALLSWGSHVMQELGTASATLAIRFTAMGQAFIALAENVFSANVFNGDAWAKTLETIKKIDAEAAAAIEKRRQLNTIASAPDTRAKAPDIIDSAKVQAQAVAMADAQQKFSESLLKNDDALAKARLANFEATLESHKAALTMTDVQIAQAHESAMDRDSAFTIASLETQLRNYSAYYNSKASLFGKDEKSIAEKAKFEMESNQKIVELLTQLEVAQIKTDTVRIQSTQRTAEAMKQHEVKALQDVRDAAQASFALQQAWYQQAPAMIGRADEARAKGMALIEAEGNLRALQIKQTIAEEDRATDAIYNLYRELHAKRIELINQFPTFWEQQLQGIVASNAFSLSTITSNFNSATAAWIQGQGNFREFWEQTQTTLLTSSLQFAEQWLVQLALSKLRELGLYTAEEAAKAALLRQSSSARIATATGEAASMTTLHTAMETSKTAATVAGEASRLGVMTATSKTSNAMMLGALAGIVAFGEASLAVLGAVVSAIGVVFESMAAALALSILGAPFAPAFATAGAAAVSGGLAGLAIAGATMQGILAAASATIASGLAKPFASGGIVTGPTLGLMGEAGSPEAAIPLNDRGAAFMQKTMGIGGGGMMQIVFESDGRTDAEYIMRYMPKVHRIKKRSR